MRWRSLAFTLFIGLGHCLDPTEIQIVLTTDLSCDEANVVAVGVGPPGNEPSSPSATSSSCDDGGLGTLVIVPSSDENAEVGLRITLGVADGSAGDQCTGPDFKGCIVARRALRYSPHHPLVLPISLEKACLDTPCGANATCVNGNCVPTGSCAPSCGSGDAGATCDAPILVAQTSSQQTPHVAFSNGTYVVGYVGATYAAVLVASNDTTTTLSPLSVYPLAGNVGPLGTSGSSIATTYLHDAGSTTFEMTILDPQAKLLTSCGWGPAIEPPIEGLPYYVDSTDAGYYLAASMEPQGLFLSACRDKMLGTGSTAGLMLPDASAPALTFGGGVFYATTSDTSAGTCGIYPFTFDQGTFTQQNAYVLTPCLAARLAVSPTLAPLYLANTSTGVAASIGPPNGFATRLGRADTQSIIALVSGSGYRALWGFAGTISTASFTDLATQPSPMTLVTSSGFDPSAGHGIGFDAASGAGLEFGLAYWASGPSGPGIYFARCH